MKSRTERHGQFEIGIVEHEGREFSALGASVNGRHVTGYTGKDGSLKTWSGQTMLDCRVEIVEEYRPNDWTDEATAVVYRLTHGRFIVGYSLGEGMLFRGELETDCTRDQAHYLAKQFAERWMGIDAEYEQQDEYEQSLLDD